jgi:hypothetical protein
MLSATRSLGLWPAPLRNSALAKISQPVASDRDRILKRGVLPMHASNPSEISVSGIARLWRVELSLRAIWPPSRKRVASESALECR